MRTRLLLTIAAALLIGADAPPPATPSPAEIIDAAPAGDWRAIAAADLLVMELAPDAQGQARRVIIQLMPPPFSQPWIGNIRKLAAARWWDGTSVNRVQDNYVVQWGDANAEDKATAKSLPVSLAKTSQNDYFNQNWCGGHICPPLPPVGTSLQYSESVYGRDTFLRSWPVSHLARTQAVWPVHCYGMVGVGRGMPPDAGTGAELYVVIGHAPRHLDRNIALVGRVAEGIEHLSSLPRGTEALGFYQTAAERTAIRSIRLASDLPEGERPRLQYLSTESASFARYADARANRRDPFFIRPAGGADVCNVPVPIRRAP